MKIDYAKRNPDSILRSIDVCEAREALERVRCENRGFVYVTKSEFQYLYKAFSSMQENIKSLELQISILDKALNIACKYLDEDGAYGKGNKQEILDSVNPKKAEPK
jgi:hypothetical protein